MFFATCSLETALTLDRVTCRPAHEPVTWPLAGAEPAEQPASPPPPPLPPLPPLPPASGLGGGIIIPPPPPQPPRSTANTVRDPRVRHIDIVSPPLSRMEVTLANM